MSRPVTGSAEQIAEYVVAIGATVIQDDRCDVWPKTTEAIAAMESVHHV
jgi:hypothetical protein